MKKASICFIILGVLFLISNVRDHIRGETSLSVPMPHSSIPSAPASSNDLKSNFEGAMIYNWLYAAGFVGLGFVGLGIHRHHERLDPLSPDFDTDRSISTQTGGK